jgi:hypothetical protein
MNNKVGGEQKISFEIKGLFCFGVISVVITKRTNPSPQCLLCASRVNVRFWRWIHPVSATHSLNISAGVWKLSVLRGLSFNCRAIALSWSCE